MVKERHHFTIDAMVIHVPRAADWPYSSMHRHVEAGMIDRAWSVSMCENDKRGYGER